MDNTPGVVRAEFASGVAVDQFFTLDGLLGALIIRTPEYREADRLRRRYARYVEDRGRRWALDEFERKGWRVPQSDARHFLPLATWGHGLAHGLWVYASSAAVADEPWEFDTAFWTRRTDSAQVVDFVDGGELPARIETGKGPYKGFHQALPLIVTAGLTWHVCGDLAKIEALLNEAPYIGKKRSQGYGRVKRWSVEKETLDCSVWRGNELMRPVPATLLTLSGVEGEFDYGYYSFRPPYHDARNLTLCAMRGRRS